MAKNTQAPVACLPIILFFLLVSLLNVKPINAQEFYLGLKTGYGQSNLDYEGNASAKIRAKQIMNVALTYNYRFSEKIGVNIETGYSDRGVKIDNSTLDYRLNYLDIPVLLDYYPVPKVRLNAGPEISYLINARNNSDDGTKTNISGNFDKRWAVNGAIGANY